MSSRHRPGANQPEEKGKRKRGLRRGVGKPGSALGAAVTSTQRSRRAGPSARSPRRVPRHPRRRPHLSGLPGTPVLPSQSLRKRHGDEAAARGPRGCLRPAPGPRAGPWPLRASCPGDSKWPSPLAPAARGPWSPWPTRLSGKVDAACIPGPGSLRPSQRSPCPGWRWRPSGVPSGPPVPSAVHTVGAWWTHLELTSDGEKPRDPASRADPVGRAGVGRVLPGSLAGLPARPCDPSTGPTVSPGARG